MVTPEQAIEIYKKEKPNDILDSVWENKRFFRVKPSDPGKKLAVGELPYIEKVTGKLTYLLPPIASRDGVFKRVLSLEK